MCIDALPRHKEGDVWASSSGIEEAEKHVSQQIPGFSKFGVNVNWKASRNLNPTDDLRISCVRTDIIWCHVMSSLNRGGWGTFFLSCLHQNLLNDCECFYETNKQSTQIKRSMKHVFCSQLLHFIKKFSLNEQVCKWKPLTWNSQGVLAPVYVTKSSQVWPFHPFAWTKRVCVCLTLPWMLNQFCQELEFIRPIRNSANGL